MSGENQIRLVGKFLNQVEGGKALVHMDMNTRRDHRLEAPDDIGGVNCEDGPTLSGSHTNNLKAGRVTSGEMNSDALCYLGFSVKKMEAALLFKTHGIFKIRHEMSKEMVVASFPTPEFEFFALKIEVGIRIEP